MKKYGLTLFLHDTKTSKLSDDDMKNTRGVYSIRNEQQTTQFLYWLKKQYSVC
jgi:hypothetical protein